MATKKSSSSSRKYSKKSTPKKGGTAKKPVKSEQKRQEELIGISVCAFGLFVLVCMVQSSITGTIGPVIKDIIIGIFGTLGYLLPATAIAIGIVLIVKKEAGIGWGQVTLWTIFVLCFALFYQVFFLRSIFTMKVIEVDFAVTTFGDYVKSTYNYAIVSNGSAGGLGALLSYWLLKNFGIFGCCFIPISYMSIVLIIKNKITLANMINKIREDMEKTPLEEIGAPSTRQTTKERQPAAVEEKPLVIHKVKEKKQDLYIENIKDNTTSNNEQRELNTDFLYKNDKKLESANAPLYTISENKWEEALDKQYQEKPAAHSEPTIQINITDNEDHSGQSTNKRFVGDSEYTFPPQDLLELSNNKANESLRAECHSNAMRLEETLRNFRVEAKVINITCGPTVTRYELRPAPGVRVSRIDGLSKELAMALTAQSIRIEAPIPNKNAVGIEVPNRTRSMVRLRDILEGSKFKSAKSSVTICVGKDLTGRNIVADLAKMPHMLVAGATGSGKSVFINSLILSLLYKSSPENVRLIMIDPKKVELNVYNGIPHLLIPVVTKPSLAASALNWAVKEMTDRYDVFARESVRNLDGYNQLAKRKDNDLKHLPRIVIIVDELADLMQVASAEVENAIYRLAQLARAAGMHLVIATQRPDVKVITGTIKANIPCRIAFSVNQLVDSRTILDESGAQHLLGNGDMLFKFGGKPIRLQGAFVADKEVEKICEFLRAEGVTYDNNVIENVKKIEKQTISNGNGDDLGSEFDNLLPDAVKVIYDNEKASTSMIQRKLRVGYNRAARIMDDLERLGVVGPSEGSKAREILVSYGTAMQIISDGAANE